MDKRILSLIILFPFLSIIACSDSIDEKEEDTLSVKEDTLSVNKTELNLYFPLLTINTTNASPIVSKEVYLNAVISIENRNNKGEITEKLFEAETEIKGRGNTSWTLAKKPYRLKLSKSAEILGMPKSKHWVLLANYSDKTLMRNQLAFEVSRRMDFAYTPRNQYVDVILNGDYIGNYLLCEQIRVDKDRVNIPELKPTDANITGGYLLEIDGRYGEPEWFKPARADMVFCIKTPEDITAYQKNYIKNYIQKIEDILYGKDGINTVTELPKYLDLKSFIDYLLVNELSKNVDGQLHLSTFVYKNRNDDKLYFGPVWDYDIAFGNVNYLDCEKTSGWRARDAAWYQQFFSHPEFEKMFNDRWKELRSGKLDDLNPFIDEWAEKMEMSQQNNFKRWPVLDKVVWFNPILPGSYAGEVGYLKNWLKERLEWMDRQASKTE
ncbi:hypothetical protein AGMMS50262_17190 [Bacteroidia bacterium]|nr:hypothetical protein AGMMS50262_17190 [Bacteroidia bacterium]